MNNYMVICIAIITMIAVGFMVIGVFAIGFFIGYKNEEAKIIKANRQNALKNIKESDMEQKAKKEWKKFLEYDGSVPERIN